MNGVYNFDGYRTPYLDMEMLMKRKALKRKRKLLILSGVATLLMTAIAIMMIALISTVSKTVAVLLFMSLGMYIIVVALMIGRFIKKGEYLWQL